MDQIKIFPLRRRCRPWRARLAAFAGCYGALDCGASSSDRVEHAAADSAGVTTTASDLRFTIDVRDAGAPISPYIYGVNFYAAGNPALMPRWPNGLTLSRHGGNRLTAYNWENNASNAGNDYNFQNDDYLGGGDVPGEAVRLEVAGAAARGAGTIVTVPMIGYVARDKQRTSVGTDRAGLERRLATRFVPSSARKGAPFSATPNAADDSVYQDEFVHWLAGRFPGAVTSGATPIYFQLDNEPDLWGSTHEELRPKTVGGESALLTYDELIDWTVAYARAVKDAAPGAVVLGPGVATWAGAATLGQYPRRDPRYGSQFFLDVYLDRLREAERAGGRRLVDVLDLHWYPAAGASGAEITDDFAEQSDAMIESRLQAPRSLWDPTYDERSWVSEVQGGPIRLLPLLKEKIAAHYPGTKLSVSEYYYGRGGDISGGIAQADVLGIFGREGVFAATLWPNAGLTAPPYGGDPARAYAYVAGAFRMYRDFDGRGGAFGDRSLKVTGVDPATTSVYASADSRDSTRLVLVVINKLPVARTADLVLTGAGARFRRGEVYVLSEGSPVPTRRGELAATGTAPGELSLSLPPRSVNTIVLH